jgi:hypothetical protein
MYFLSINYGCHVGKCGRVVLYIGIGMWTGRKNIVTKQQNTHRGGNTRERLAEATEEQENKAEEPSVAAAEDSLSNSTTQS